MVLLGSGRGPEPLASPSYGMLLYVDTYRKEEGRHGRPARDA